MCIIRFFNLVKRRKKKKYTFLMSFIFWYLPLLVFPYGLKELPLICLIRSINNPVFQSLLIWECLYFIYIFKKLKNSYMTNNFTRSIYIRFLSDSIFFLQIFVKLFNIIPCLLDCIVSFSPVFYFL